MTPSETKRIIELFEEAGLDPFRYSGRGMFGRECLAVQFDEESFGVGITVALAAKEMGMDETWLQPLKHPRCDSMGRDVVLYFPNIPWMEDDVDYDDE